MSITVALKQKGRGLEAAPTLKRTDAL